MLDDIGDDSDEETRSRLFSEMDVDGSGGIDFEEYLTVSLCLVPYLPDNPIPVFPHEWREKGACSSARNVFWIIRQYIWCFLTNHKTFGTVSRHCSLSSCRIWSRLKSMFGDSFSELTLRIIRKLNFHTPLATKLGGLYWIHPVCLSACLPVSLSVFLSLCLSVKLSSVCLFVCLSVC